MKCVFYKLPSIIAFIILSILFIGCKKFLVAPMPVDQLNTEAVFKDRITILGAVDGMYNGFANGILMGNVHRLTYIISDEGFIDPIPGTEFGDIIAGNLQEGNQQLIPWLWYYLSIYRANELIERLPLVPNNIMPEGERIVLISAAKYVRAVCYFNITNFWGDAPLSLTTNAQTNKDLDRTPKELIYEQILKDLYDAVANLPSTVNTNNPKTIHNKFQPLAFLSRVHLYLGQWVRADSAATAVIESGQFKLATGVNNVFKRGSPETIHAWGPTNQGLLFDNRTVIGWLTLPATAGNTTTTHVHITPQILAYFEPGDKRNVNGNWTINLFNRTFSNKYLYHSATPAATIAANPQDFIFQRLGEIYLIRAEARAMINNFSGALADLNTLRKRAELPNLSPANNNNISAIMTAIEKERVCELFYEGHRWFDLKRWGKLNAVLSVLPWKTTNYKPHMILLPIIRQEMIANPKLIQNPGY